MMRAGRWKFWPSAPGCGISSCCGEQFVFPANGYRGDYIAAIGEQLFAADGPELRRSAAEVFKDLPPDEPQGGDKDTYIDAVIARARHLIGETRAFRRVLDLALAGILGDIRDDLREFGVTFDCWFSERSLSEERLGRPGGSAS